MSKKINKIFIYLKYLLKKKEILVVFDKYWNIVNQVCNIGYPIKMAQINHFCGNIMHAMVATIHHNHHSCEAMKQTGELTKRMSCNGINEVGRGNALIP